MIRWRGSQKAQGLGRRTRHLDPRHLTEAAGSGTRALVSVDRINEGLTVEVEVFVAQAIEQAFNVAGERCMSELHESELTCLLCCVHRSGGIDVIKS